MCDGTFDCYGKVNIFDWQLSRSSLLLNGAIESVLNTGNCRLDNEITFEIFDCVLPGTNVVLNLKHFTRCMEMKLKQLSRYDRIDSLNNASSNYYSARRSVCKFLLHMRDYLETIKQNCYTLRDLSEDSEKDFEDLLCTIRKFLNQLTKVADSTFHYAMSALGNKCNQPEFHMYHLHLDMRWLMIILIHARGVSWQTLNDKQFDDLDAAFSSVISDLVYISVKMFATIPTLDLKMKSPFSCTCSRELWLMLQLMSDELAERKICKPFWSYVNATLNKILLPKDEKTVNYLFNCKNPELFCFWLIYHLTLLYGYNRNGVYLSTSSNRIKSNHEEIDQILKTYVNKGGKDGARDEIDEELKIIIPWLRVLIGEWWNPQVVVISLLWDCFHRRLDQPYLTASFGPWAASNEKKTPTEILKQVRERIQSGAETSNESSFGLFLQFLGVFLQSNRTDIKFWNQIKGRIFCKFSKGKVQEFSEAGLYNFISLFLTLALVADTVNVCTVMFGLLPKVLEWSDVSTAKNCCLAWKSKLVVLLLYKEQKLSYQEVAESFTDIVNVICCRADEYSRNMMNSFIDVLSNILSTSDFGNYEYLFLGGWIDRYLLDCPINRAETLTSLLVTVFDKCKRSNSLGETAMLNAMWSHVASRVRQMVIVADVNSDYYRNTTRLAVAFTLEAIRDTALAKRHRHSAASLFQHFTTSIIMKDMRITRMYLALILRETSTIQHLKSEISNFDLSCIQAWIKCCILNCDPENEEGKFLKKYIISLQEIKELFTSTSDIREFLESSRPIVPFVHVLSKRRKLKSEYEKNAFDAKCRQYFHNMEKWAILSITEENKDSELANWIYQAIGNIIVYCSPMFYTKNQPSSVLRILINKIALPPEPSFLTFLGQKIFPMLISGIDNVNAKADIYLRSLLRDLFERYLPLMITNANKDNIWKVSEGLLRVFQERNPNLVRVIVEMLSTSFLTTSGNTTHKNCHLVMLLLKHLLKGGKVYPDHVTEAVASICPPSIIKCYVKVHDGHPHRQQTIEFFRDVSYSVYYKETQSIREKFHDIIWNDLQKYISSNTQIIFEFLNILSKSSVHLYQYLYPKVENIVLECEKQKRPNAGSLRYLFGKLQRNVEVSRIQL